MTNAGGDRFHNNPYNNLMNPVQLTRNLVRFNTVNPTSHESECAHYLGKYLEDRGFDVQYFEFAEKRTSLIARMKGSGDGLPLCFTGHIDTVPLGAADWSYDPFAADLDGDRITGRGTTDMKAGVAAFVIAAEEATRNKRPAAGLELVITAGEETGCDGAFFLAEQNVLAHCGAIVVGEPTSNYPLVGHKGAYWGNLVATGITAHGSMPEQGENAIYKAARAVSKLENFDWKGCRHDVLGTPTLNVGTITGGMNLNSVPDRAVVGVDIRTIPGQSHERIRSDLAALLGDEISFDEMIAVEGIWSDPQGEWVRKTYGFVEEVTGVRSEVRGATYFTDGPILSRASGNPPTIILGPGEATMAHQTDEYCSINRLEQSVELYRKIALDWCY